MSHIIHAYQKNDHIKLPEPKILSKATTPDEYYFLCVVVYCLLPTQQQKQAFWEEYAPPTVMDKDFIIRYLQVREKQYKIHIPNILNSKSIHERYLQPIIYKAVPRALSIILKYFYDYGVTSKSPFAKIHASIAVEMLRQMMRYKHSNRIRRALRVYHHYSQNQYLHKYYGRQAVLDIPNVGRIINFAYHTIPQLIRTQLLAPNTTPVDTHIAITYGNNPTVFI